MVARGPYLFPIARLTFTSFAESRRGINARRTVPGIFPAPSRARPRPASMDHIGARDCGPRYVYVVKGAIGETSKRPDWRRRFNAKRGDTFHIPLHRAVGRAGCNYRDRSCPLTGARRLRSARWNPPFSPREIPYSRFSPSAVTWEEGDREEGKEREKLILLGMI